LALLQLRWKVVCEDLNDIGKRIKDPSTTEAVRTALLKLCQMLQGNEHQLRQDIRQLVPSPVDPNLQLIYYAWVDHNKSIQAYLEKLAIRRP